MIFLEIKKRLKYFAHADSIVSLLLTFAIVAIPIEYAEAYLGHCQTPVMKLYVKIVNEL